MIRFTCPACKAVLRVADAHAGKKGPCPKCGQRLLVPPPQRAMNPRNQTMLGVANLEDEPIQTSEAPLPAARDFDEDDCTPARMPAGTKIGLAALTVTIACVLVVGIVVAARSSDPKASKAAPASPTSTTRRQPYTRGSPVSDDDSFAPAVVGLSFFVLLSILGLLYFVAWILLLAWVARDAKNRSIDSGAVWVILVFFLHLVGLLVYVASRPSGALITCNSCQNRKLNYARVCPHCGHESPQQPS